MSFQQGLSGLNAASRNLDVIGNNIANVGTVGFKSSTTLFADVYANSLAGAGSDRVGIGVAVAGVMQNFTQGNITTTSNPLDIAINGNGFFRLSQDGAIVYSRNGQFRLDADGYIVNASGARLTGIQAVNGQLAGSETELRIAFDGAGQPQATTEANVVANLDAEAEAVTVTPFNPQDPRTYTHSTSLTCYDAEGRRYTVALYYVKTGSDQWAVYGMNGNTPLNDDPATPELDPLTVLNFTNGRIPDGDPSLRVTGIDAGNFVFDLDLTGTTQYAGESGIVDLGQNGYGMGRMTGIAVGEDGLIQVRYSNGRTEIVGQIRLVDFRNPNGLQPIGNNLFAETPDSGTPIPGAPLTGRMGALRAGAVEESNVDLTQELVNMITAQRAYQANAQTIKTQDQLMQTIVNLR